MIKSAGILLFRKISAAPEFFLVHPGGPFWKNKDNGAWSIPKGEYHEGEEPLEAARREFEEETGFAVNGNFIELTPVKQKSGKWVSAWACEKNIEAAVIRSNTFPLEWPPRSGKFIQVPEVDRAQWFKYEDAKNKLLPAQVPLLEELYTILSSK